MKITVNPEWIVHGIGGRFIQTTKSLAESSTVVYVTERSTLDDVMLKS